MARIRTIKPDFFLNEVLASLPAHDRLLFIGLWTLADREGRLENRPERIKAHIFPYEKVSVVLGLKRLAEKNMVIFYGGETNDNYLVIPTFTKHQCPNIKESESQLPSPPEYDTSIIPVCAYKEGKGKEGKGKERKDTIHSLVDFGLDKVPANLSSMDRFIETYNNWLMYRIEDLREPATRRTVEAQLKMLSVQPNPIAIIERSIANTWRGLFELKPGVVGKEHPPSPFDFSVVFNRYPEHKRIEDVECREIFNATVKTEQDFRDIQEALENYIGYERKNGTEMKYYKTAPKWFQVWRGWIPNANT